MILDFLFPPRCYVCGKPGHYFCPHCYRRLDTLALIPNSAPFQGRLSLFKYNTAIRRCLNDLKYKFVTDLCQNLTSLVCRKINTDFPHLLSYWRQHHFCLTPVPLHPRRRHFRGFNQSAILAQSLAFKLKLSYASDLLIRSRPTPPQVSLAKTKRLHNIKNAFRINPSVSVPPNIILFDDVFTTGATIRSAASAFPQNSHIWIFTIAG